MKENYETLLDALTNEMQALHKELQECKEKLSQKPCGDCISREKALQIIRAWFDREATPSDLKNEIEQLPPVTPQSKMGKWEWIIDVSEETPVSPEEIEYDGWGCSICHNPPDDICDWDDPNDPPTHKYCPNCGCKMQEVEE